MAADWRKQRELEEARKAGIAEPARDEDGNEINPHIPQFMSSAPWYLNNDQPSLKHQKNWKDGPKDTREWYKRGKKAFQATKFRKGACENCGSMTHKSKDCLERPRAKGAKFTGKHIAADDVVEDINLEAFDAKRDRWNGYDNAEYKRVVDRYERIEELRKQAKAEELAKQEGLDAEKARKAAEAELAGDEKVAEEEQAGFAKVERRVRTVAGGASGSIRNLRIREDTAKYLLNLDIDSAYYDPKSRSMREDPNPNKDPREKHFQGDNFVRQSGDYQGWQALNLHAIQAQDKGVEVNALAAPSQAAALYKQFKEKKANVAKTSKQSALEKYGSAAAEAPEEFKRLGQTEGYVEYDRAGRVIQGKEAKVVSRYEEDVFPQNHTSVWGSYWADGQWGFACCRSTVRSSYCTGAAGIEAKEAAAAQMQANMEADAQRRAAREAEGNDMGAAAAAHREARGLWGGQVEEGTELDPEKVKEALRRHEEREKAAAEGRDDRKRGYNSLREEQMTQEDMEAYRLKRVRADDPMARPAGGGGGQYDLV
ncbi:unnamed protein product [Pedinophyceae sp. YPF-701]|nr:unnamed protein product [Pedinophyceae sp. YPF-701]